ncbi:MAG: hypothetical protein A2X84_02920 [Desulfuromonadaceae bacterium GWC2_58_13]|nr:MAG: hypothetical protein A2X84_02920 [Desulfuromonadaceae bacterium GWC2_58_13]
MKRFKTYIQLTLMAMLLLGGASMTVAVAAGAPQISSLGQIRDGFVSPTRIDVDGQGNLYVVDARTRLVSKFDKYGKKGRGTNVFDAVSASGGGLAVTPDGSLLFVAEQKSVAVINGVTGDLLGYLGGKDRFSYVYDIDVDANGFVFVADANRLKVEVFRPGASGAVPYLYDYQFGSKGVAPGQLMGLAAMNVNAAAGEVYIADPVTHKPEGATVPVSYPKVQVYDLAGNLKKVQAGSANFILLGSKSFGTPQVSFFGGMTFDGQGRGDFTDSYSGRVNVLNLQGTDPLKMYLSTYAKTGFAQGQLSDPRDAVFDSVTGRLFVLCGDGRVEIFGIDGAVNPVKINNPPTVPELCTPIAGSETASATPHLTWLAAVDPDDDAVEYRVQLGLVGETPSAHAGIKEIGFTVPGVLRENGMYSWMAQAFDGEVASDWAPSQTFYVNAEEEPPSTPVLLAPADGEVVDGMVPFVWQPSTDPDPFDAISYVLQVSEDAGFSRIVFDEILDGTSVLLGDCTGYPVLDDGNVYFWRVTANDSTGLESVASDVSKFVYDTTELTVTANVPDARVYVAGNHAFAGRYVGNAPVVLRDFPVGAGSVVVEHAGYETYVAQVNLQERQNVSVHAALINAKLPDGLNKISPLKADKKKIQVGADAAPFYVDFDNDGRTDLLVGNAAGTLLFYPGLSDKRLEFASAEPVDLPIVIPGAVPFVADWNNDHRKDLLVGGADGTVMLFLNLGTESRPVWGEGVPLAHQGGVLDVGKNAIPVVIDLDNDGAKDLVVGSGNGAIVYYRNIGTDKIVELSYVRNLLQLKPVQTLMPFLTDWNSDGNRDLLVSVDGQFFSFLRQDGGDFAPGEKIEIKGGLLSSEVSHFFVCDIDGEKGKDLLVGTVTGEVFPVLGNGNKEVKAAISEESAESERKSSGK